MIRAATFSHPRMRATLLREWDPALPRGMFIGANPGQADGMGDDATARKYVGFAQRWGWGSYVAGNLFQWVATDMGELIELVKLGLSVNPPDTDLYIAKAALDVHVVCVAWGNTPPAIRSTWERRVREVLQVVRYLDQPTLPIVCAGLTKQGAPAHLSRRGYTSKPIAYDVG